MLEPKTLHPVSYLFDIIEGPIKFSVFDWALNAGLFDICTQWTALCEISRQLNVPDDKVTLILRALLSMDLLCFEAGKYRTAPDFVDYLTTQSDKCLTVTLNSLSELRHAGLDQLSSILTDTDKSAAKRVFDEVHWEKSHKSLQGFHRATAADEMLACLKALPEWENATSFLDIGGGSDVLSHKILNEKPDACTMLFDLEPVIEQVKNSHHEDIVNLVLSAGNYNEVSRFPKGPFDIIWCSMSLYFHNDGLDALIRNITSRLAAGGVIVSFHEALSNNRSSPKEHVIGRLLPALRHKDVSFSEGEISAAMKEAGLINISSKDHDTPFGRYRLDVGRKG